MTIDHSLAVSLGPGEAVLRLYLWDRATVSFGRHQPAGEGYSALRERCPQLGFVRRPTGGRAVLHDQELTYSVVLPAAGSGGPRQSYRNINKALLRGIEALGTAVALAPSGPALRPDAGPCFGHPAQGEVVSGSRKLVGSAQARVGTSILQHGSILLAGSQGLLEGIEGDPAQRGDGAITLEELLGRRLPPEELIDPVMRGFEEVFRGRWSEIEGPVPEEVVDTTLLARYSSDDWTWRH